MRKLAGAIAGLMLAGVPTGVALAGGTSAGGSASAPPSGSAAGSYGAGGSAATSMAGKHQLSGRVLKASENSITVLSKGAAIPLDVQSSTKFSGGLSSASDVKAGDQIRATYQLKAGSNELTSVARVTSGTQGAPGGAMGGTGGGTGSSSSQKGY